MRLSGMRRYETRMKRCTNFYNISEKRIITNPLPAAMHEKCAVAGRGILFANYSFTSSRLMEIRPE